MRAKNKGKTKERKKGKKKNREKFKTISEKGDFPFRSTEFFCLARWSQTRLPKGIIFLSEEILAFLLLAAGRAMTYYLHEASVPCEFESHPSTLYINLRYFLPKSKLKLWMAQWLRLRLPSGIYFI
jgi:hypothetical protein